MDQGYLHAEYNAMTLHRFKVRSEQPLPTGKVTIEVEIKFDSRQRRSGGTITFRVDGEQVGQGRFEDSVPVIFTASETFDIGMDLGSPVSLDYHERAPFKFNGTIEKINIKYI
jgi:arylsulfatase